MLAVVLAAVPLGAATNVSSLPRLAVRDSVVVTGTVFDSLAGAPLAGAVIQFAGADSMVARVRLTARSDSNGVFVLRNVPVGRYIAGFYHPALDTLGLEAAQRIVVITRAASLVNLGTPSATTIVAAFCQSDVPSSAGIGLLLGHVRDTRNESAAEGATVSVSWSEVQATKHGIGLVDRQGNAQSRTAGWFALCGVPRDAEILVRARRGGAVSGSVAVHVPTNGVVHLTLSLGTPGNRDGRIVGIVRNQARRPIASAQVALEDASDEGERTNDAGEFIVGNVPPGTRSLTIRAIGYAPKTVIVQVNDGAATRADVLLEPVVTLPAVVTRDSVREVHMTEFLRDRSTDAVGGYFVQPKRLPGYEAQQTVCQLIGGLPRVRCSYSDGRASLGRCSGFILNGMPTQLDVTDLDPDDILGVEVFTHGAPVKYQKYIQALGTCAVVVWTRCPGFVVPRCPGAPTRPAAPARASASNRRADLDFAATTA